MSINTPLVSVGMPVFNGEKYIRESLDSLLGQTFTDFELLISDNASTDGTETICREYAGRDSRIRYIRQERNLGIAANFEFVLKESRGQYFTWAASDDLEGSTAYLQELVNAMTGGTRDLALPAVDIISTASDGTSQYLKRDTMDRFLKCSSAADFCVTTVHVNAYHMFGLFRREVLLENVRYIQIADEKIGAFHDGLLAHAVSSNLRLGFVPTARKVYRLHSTNESSTAYSPLQYLARYLRYSRLCATFWLRESNAPVGTRTRVLLVMLYRHSRGTAHFVITSAKYLAAQTPHSLRRTLFQLKRLT